MTQKIPPVPSNSPKVVVELGIGNGRFLKKLVEMEKENNSNATTKIGSLYIGIELDSSKYDTARSALQSYTNVTLLHGSFEKIIHDFSDRSIDEIISVLPDPDFIDREKQKQWEKFYRVAQQKLSRKGRLRLVTELIDDLLQPVPEEAYKVWVRWLVKTFQDLGFFHLQTVEGSPLGYESECLERFRPDPERIRIATFDFVKYH
jgi:putative methyltransferase